MFARKCPDCQKPISFQVIKTYPKNESVECSNCHVKLTVKTFDYLVNSVILGLFLGVFLGVFTELSVDWIIISGALVSIFGQKYLDMFFSLKKYEE